MKRLLVLFAIAAAAAFAADLNGTWKATAEGPNGVLQRTFTFKVEGAKLTGETTSEMMGKSTITDGKVEGDNITFNITGKFGDNEMKLSYKGKVTGDELHLTSQAAGGEGQAIEWKGKKAQ